MSVTKVLRFKDGSKVYVSKGDEGRYVVAFQAAGHPKPTGVYNFPAQQLFELVAFLAQYMMSHEPIEPEVTNIDPKDPRWGEFSGVNP